jgi:UDP-N-acetylmuramoyl-tripeptide--D-alanyl-D-alanine ligase
MKRYAKKIIVHRLGKYVRQLRQKNKIVVIGVAGSIGKSSTKRAIAQVLGAGKKVQWQDGNYNDLVSVPLVFFGLTMPKQLLNPVAWLKIMRQAKRQLRSPYPFDVVVVEIGTDYPGSVAAFSEYLQLDMAVVTAVAPEHMEFFNDLQAVADEELSIAGYSKKLVVAKDMVAPEYLANYKDYLTYSLTQTADARLVAQATKQHTYEISIETKTSKYAAAVPFIGEHQLQAVAAAALVAECCDLSQEEINQGLSRLTPMPGRMQTLPGKKDSLIIDDSYNASPEAMRAALDTVYGLEAPQRIVLLGNMNELGSVSRSMHLDLGGYCDATRLDLVVTLGPDANQYLAQAAETKGCNVIRTQSPSEAGKVILDHLKADAIVLIKGSQNGVFAEEAIKPLLANPTDASKLVRQTESWLAIKSKQFGKVES